MMIFHSDSDEIGVSVSNHAVTIAVNDRAYVIEMNTKDRVDLGIMLINSANEKHNEIF